MILFLVFATWLFTLHLDFHSSFPTGLLCLPLTKCLVFFPEWLSDLIRLGKIMLNTKSILWGNCIPSLMSDSCPLSKHCPCSITQVIYETIESHFGWDRHLWLSASSLSGRTPPVSALTEDFTQKFHPNEALLSCSWEITHKKRGLSQAFFLHCSCERYFHKAAVLFVGRKINTNKAQRSNKKAPRLCRFLRHAASLSFR